MRKGTDVDDEDEELINHRDFWLEIVEHREKMLTLTLLLRAEWWIRMIGAPNRYRRLCIYRACEFWRIAKCSP